LACILARKVIWKTPATTLSNTLKMFSLSYQHSFWYFFI
jgi:hypothetical protein